MIRVVSFLSTVVPSQFHNCFQTKFPEAAEQLGDPNGWEHNWSEYLKMGMGGLKGGGGCSDLIFSGHGVTNLVFILPYRDYHSGWVYAFLLLCWLWFAIATIMSGHHYSVDLILAGIVGILVWDTYGLRAMTGPCTRLTMQCFRHNEKVPLPIRLTFLVMIYAMVHSAVFIGA